MPPPTGSGLVAADMFGGKREQRQVPRPLDGDGQSTLMLGTRAGFASGLDLASFGQGAAQGGHVFIIDRLGFFQAKGAYFAPAGKPLITILETPPTPTAGPLAAVLLVVSIVPHDLFFSSY
jgi:hypothetical protein